MMWRSSVGEEDNENEDVDDNADDNDNDVDFADGAGNVSNAAIFSWLPWLRDVASAFPFCLNADFFLHFSKSWLLDSLN